MSGKAAAGLITAIIFYFATLLPLTAMVFPSLTIRTDVKEKRNLKALPTFRLNQLSNYPKAFESYFNDNFGFRAAFIRLNNLLKYELFQVSGTKKVLVGKKGWLYYTGNSVVDDYRGINTLSHQDLELWKNVLERKRDWLSSQGIAYFFIVAPNKHSIYPEFLPKGVMQVSGTTPLDQIGQYLKSNSNVNFLDLRSVLISRKSEGQLYYLTDTHWTNLGAFFGYEAIANHIRTEYPNVKPLQINELKMFSKKNTGLDLATMLGIQDVLTENITTLIVSNKKSIEIRNGDKVRNFQTGNSFLPKAVMFKDSFGMRLVPYLSENFQSIQFISKKWDKDTPIQKIINDSKPDIVIEEWCERYLKNMEWVSVHADL